MPSNTQQTILDTFNQAAGSPASGSNLSGLIAGLLPASGQSLPEALTQATQAIGAQTQATSANTDAVVQATSVRGRSDSGGGAADVVNTVSQILGGGLSLMPLVSIFTSLFGGGDEAQPAPLVQYSLPPALHLETTSNYQDVTYGENGLPRAADVQPAAPNAAPQITVQVQAMDSRSFLDHSDEIAQAVRQAMLNMNSINDVVTDL
jgi:hypothetical protein